MAKLIINQTVRDALPEAALRSQQSGELELEATTVRGLLRELEKHYPGVTAGLTGEMAVAIDGEIHADALLQPLTAGSEVCFVPAIEGG